VGIEGGLLPAIVPELLAHVGAARNPRAFKKFGVRRIVSQGSECPSAPGGRSRHRGWLAEKLS